MKFGLSVMSDSTGVFTEWDAGFEGEDVVHEFLGFIYWHSFDVVEDFTAVFEVDSEVGSS